MKYLRLILIMILLITLNTSADVILVPQDQPTLKAALDVAAENDTVRVEGGDVKRNAYYDSRSIIVFGPAVLGSSFSTFVSRITDLPSGERSAVVDSFMSAASAFPYIDDEILAYFIHRGGGGAISVPGDANGWNANEFAMKQLEDTNLWYYEFITESDARLDYKIVRNGSWNLDPLNPNTVSGGFGPNSELAMPAYVQPQEIISVPNIPKGTLVDTTLASSILGNSRQIRVYLPSNYDAAPNDSFPMILFHDGLEYLQLASAKNVFDNLIHQQQIEPVIAVFVPPVNRSEEYAFGQRLDFEDFIIDEVMPMIEAKFRIEKDPKRRAMTGPSFGGLITTQITFNNPDIFGLSAPISPSYWANNGEVINAVANGVRKPIRFFLDWGTYEGSILTTGRLMSIILASKNYDWEYREWHEGHSWGSWRAHMDDFLIHFFPGNAVGIAETLAENVPSSFQLLQNYPNPFNPSTTIKYQLNETNDVSFAIYNLLGQLVKSWNTTYQTAGEYSIVWNGIDQFGNNVSSGVYIYQLRVGDAVQTRKMMLVK